jgi:hypothetical protein
MTLKYIHERDDREEPKAIRSEKELSLKHGELFRGEVPTGIVMEKNHPERTLLIAGAVAIAGYFIAKKIASLPERFTRD